MGTDINYNALITTLASQIHSDAFNILLLVPTGGDPVNTRAQGIYDDSGFIIGLAAGSPFLPTQILPLAQTIENLARQILVLLPQPFPPGTVLP